MTQIDEFFVQIAKFVLKKTDFSFSRAQTMIKQHTDKLSQIGDIGFPTTIQPWLNIVKDPNDVKDLNQIIDEDEDEFARKLIEISSEWAFPIESVRFKQFRCLLFLDRPKCFSGVLRTVLFDDANYGEWYRAHNTDDDKNRIYAVQLVKQSEDNNLVEHRCMLTATVLDNLLRVSGIKTVTKSKDNERNANNLSEIFVTSARKGGAKRINRQNNEESNNNNNNNSTKFKPIVCGSVVSKSGNSADEYIR